MGDHDIWVELQEDIQDYAIVHELLHSRVPNHGKLWKSLMRAHLGAYEEKEAKLKEIAHKSLELTWKAGSFSARHNSGVRQYKTKIMLSSNHVIVLSDAINDYSFLCAYYDFLNGRRIHQNNMRSAEEFIGNDLKSGNIEMVTDT